MGERGVKLRNTCIITSLAHTKASLPLAVASIQVQAASLSATVQP